MSYVLTEEQELLKSSAADFVKKESPVSRIRCLRDSNDPDGFSRDLWRKMAELGWQAIIVPEEYGGLGMGLVDLACVLEECGRNLVPEPLVSVLLLGGGAVLAAGSHECKQSILPGIVDGSLLVTLAHHERDARYELHHVACRAQRKGAGFVLDGEKTLVPDGHVADKLVVTARTSGDVSEADGISMFIVDAGAAGLEITRQSTMDLRNAAVVKLDGVEVTSGAILGEEGRAGAALSHIIDRATVGLCAEMLGMMEGAFAMTLDYLRTRKQFGVPIGSFQALKHRAAMLFVEIELSRSAMLGAAHALDAGAPDAASLVSVAKARCSDTVVLAGYEGIQMHGGIGMTDEHDIGFFAKRARGAELTFGDAAYHRDRFARLTGF